MGNISIREWIKKYDAGEFDSPDWETQCKAGWYDWFCKDGALKGRLDKLAPKVKQIAQSPKVNIDEMYVFFKNNCPMAGPLYDDFRICDLQSGDVIFTVVPSEPRNEKGQRSEVWGIANGFNGPLVKGDWNDVKKYFEVK